MSDVLPVIEPIPPRKVRWRLWVAYDGTAYCGFQFQKGLVTVESVLKEALSSLLNQEVSITPAGRTDSGVHARGQVISCEFESRFNAHRLILGLEHRLPRDVSVWRADEMVPSFHAKRHSIGKQYIYRIWQALVPDPFCAKTSWHIRQKLDLAAMQTAAGYLLFEQNFESFRSSQCTATHAIRYLWLAQISRQGSMIEIDIRGNAFCHHMVRIMVGTLVDVGRGRCPPERVKSVLQARDRTLAGKTAPARGLTLERVFYPDDLTCSGIPEGAQFPRFPVSQVLREEARPCLGLDS